MLLATIDCFSAKQRRIAFTASETDAFVETLIKSGASSDGG